MAFICLSVGGILGTAGTCTVVRRRRGAARYSERAQTMPSMTSVSSTPISVELRPGRTPLAGADSAASAYVAPVAPPSQ